RHNIPLHRSPRNAIQRYSSPAARCFFFNDTPTTKTSTLSLHDALPISRTATEPAPSVALRRDRDRRRRQRPRGGALSRAREIVRSEEHTSELQSRRELVCRLLRGKKTKGRARAAGRESGGRRVRTWRAS